MTKILNIIYKDLIVLARDRASLVLMLLAPFLLTIGMGAITGSFGTDDNPDAPQGIRDIPLVIINRDEGELGQALVDVLQSDELATLLAPTLAESSDAATETAVREQVETDEIAALVLIPAGFTSGTIPDSETGQTSGAQPVEIYASPARPISQSIIESVVTEFINEVDLNTAVMQVTMIQLVTSGKVPIDEAADTGEAIAQELFAEGETTNANGQIERLLTVDSQLSTGEEADNFNPLTYLAPSMAIFFLMYTVTVGGRSILAEREEGTLDRLLTTPTTTTQILLGKIAAIFVSGVLQVGVLILTSALLFSLSWGSPLGVFLLIVSASAAATAWGLLVTSLANNAGQVGAYGSAVMLLFGIVGGSFLPVGDVPGLNILSKLTPNGWALDGFTTLGTGGSLLDVAPVLLALWLMALLVFATAVFFYRRRWRQQ